VLFKFSTSSLKGDQRVTSQPLSKADIAKAMPQPPEPKTVTLDILFTSNLVFGAVSAMKNWNIVLLLWASIGIVGVVATFFAKKEKQQ
jgi:hypothetical protein